METYYSIVHKRNKNPSRSTLNTQVLYKKNTYKHKKHTLYFIKLQFIPVMMTVDYLGFF
ncbi:hypothetical protein N481_24725 [Pseudoalteromonas luteoviolacea S4047-1]|uniref:Uncharacterized protein n=1 Tax=Pseudoalteromonas luteoviolacea S4054 TaxID=1129367 RepID=A0A0F6A6K5_9GAMM|nr:hypothetical protein N479_02355 [Pseudoalteromonas luteoviolacea S4054]KZN66220.1 hypothetical protein N481_24725 [Pseudoalteromonas luteoviolacea S4047-1]